MKLLTRWYVFVPLVLLVLPTALTGYYTRICGYSRKEAWTAVKYFVRSSTRFAEGFSHAKFKQVEPGMDAAAVFDLLGEPLDRLENNTEWVYAQVQGQTDFYHERTIIFDRDSLQRLRVKNVVKQFHAEEAEKKPSKFGLRVN